MLIHSRLCCSYPNKHSAVENILLVIRQNKNRAFDFQTVTVRIAKPFLLTKVFQCS